MNRINFIAYLILFFAGHFCDAQIITTIAGNGNPGSSGDGGPATNAEFFNMDGLVADKLGNIYVADNMGDAIHKIDNTGVITRFAGTGAHGFSGDGGVATAAQLYLGAGSVGLAVDSVGNVYLADGSRVRMVNTSGIITTVVGSTSFGYSGDGGPATAASLAEVTGICFDRVGNLYIADDENNNIRLVTTTGIISTIAGTTIGFSGDGGPATNAQLNSPEEIAINDSGDMYICDAGNYRVRKIDVFGTINTIAGTGPTGMGGDYCEGCPATAIKLICPAGVAVDHNQNIILSDCVTDLIYKVNAFGLLYKIAGDDRTSGFSGDGGPASAALFNTPTLLCIDNVGNLLLIDKENYRIRKIWFTPANVPKVVTSQFSIYPNPTTGSINIKAASAVNIKVYNTMGQLIKEAGNTDNISIAEYPPDMYFIRLFNTEGLPVYQSKIIKE